MISETVKFLKQLCQAMQGRTMQNKRAKYSNNSVIYLLSLKPNLIWKLFNKFLADRTNGRAIATLLRLSSSSVCLSVCDVMYCG